MCSHKNFVAVQAARDQGQIVWHALEPREGRGWTGRIAA
jgi:hypothetical protein